MNEIAEIIAAFDGLCRQDKSAALALVIGVEGSAYRRPGARMLIAEDGRSWGGVSGGCLERDVARRARGVIVTGQPVICRYDGSDDDEISPAAATGCGGTVVVLIQKISKQSPAAMAVLKDAMTDRREIRLATRIRGGEISEHMMLGNSADTFSDDFFVETISPPQELIIFGSGPDAVPLCAIAKTLGWHVSVVANRPASMAAERFAMADALHVTGADDPLAGVMISPRSAVVVMTHNLARDQKILSLLPTPLRYLGLLGPRQRAERIAVSVPRDLSEMFAPVGLDLGARTPQEIALAIVAEIQAVIGNAAGGSLRDASGPIHARVVERAACGLALPRQSR
jgi:xanthine/CO dehydrogenase XdhC/CoxF family maturation factor